LENSSLKISNILNKKDVLRAFILLDFYGIGRKTWIMTIGIRGRQLNFNRLPLMHFLASLGRLLPGIALSSGRINIENIVRLILQVLFNEINRLY